MLNEKNARILERMLSEDLYMSPYRFAMWAYPWGEGSLKGFDGPRSWQRDQMLEIEGYLLDAMDKGLEDGTFPDFYRHAVASGRGPGKSAQVGMLSHWFISTRIGGSVWVAANGEPQLRTKTFPEISKWVAMGINADFFDTNALSVQPKQWFRDYIESPGGLHKSTRYYYISGQLWSAEVPDAFAGAHNYDGEMAIFDEASGIPEVIWGVQEGVFTENIPDRVWLAYSNPRSSEGAFFECFHKNRARWRTTQIDSRTVEGVSQSTYQGIIDAYGEDSDQARVEVYGQFPREGQDQFISPFMVKDAVARKPYNDKTAPVIIGIDPARSGLDSTVIVVRQGRDLIQIKRYNGEDTMQIVGRVIDALEWWKPDMAVIDEGGLGYGILDRLNEQGYKVRGVNFGWKANNTVMFGNKRAEMWGSMKDWLKTGHIPDDKELVHDLSAPRREPDSKGTIFLEPKKKMKARGLASPDAADALAVTFAYPVANKEVREMKTVRRTARRGFNLSGHSWMG